jgi:hypothetical protein
MEIVFLTIRDQSFHSAFAYDLPTYSIYLCYLYTKRILHNIDIRGPDIKFGEQIVFTGSNLVTTCGTKTF